MQFSHMHAQTIAAHLPLSGAPVHQIVLSVKQMRKPVGLWEPRKLHIVALILVLAKLRGLYDAVSSVSFVAVFLRRRSCRHRLNQPK